MGRHFQPVDPNEEDIAIARALPASACPRRYCWWWHSLDFDWELTSEEGCRYFEEPKPAHWEDTDKPCCRCDSESAVDHYEPREPHLEADGFDRDRFV